MVVTAHTPATCTDPDLDIYTSQYDAAGRLTTLLQGLGSEELYSYDTADHLTTLIELNAVGTPIMTMVDRYYAVGNRT